MISLTYTLAYRNNGYAIYQASRIGNNTMEANSIEELVEAGINDLQKLADSGNTVARKWLGYIQQQAIPIMKLHQFGEMRISLLGMLAISPEAKQVYDAMWPEEGDRR